MSLTTARLAVALDEGLALVTHVYWSSDGLAISASLAATSLTGVPKLNAASNANPSISSNNGALESAASSGAVTITHFAFGHDDAGDVLDTSWNALTDAAVLLLGGKITLANAALKEHLHQTTAAPS